MAGFAFSSSSISSFLMFLNLNSELLNNVKTLPRVHLHVLPGHDPDHQVHHVIQAQGHQGQAPLAQDSGPSLGIQIGLKTVITHSCGRDGLLLNIPMIQILASDIRMFCSSERKSINIILITDIVYTWRLEISPATSLSSNSSSWLLLANSILASSLLGGRTRKPCSCLLKGSHSSSTLTSSEFLAAKQALHPEISLTHSLTGL